MKTDADDGEANAKPPLVCAPCWICLEEGPDEAGEPLVRDCACRGSTSAGYHLSCVFAYVKRKIDEEVRRGLEHGPPMNDERGILVNSYTCCPNCTTPYMSNFATALFERVVEFTDDLPNTHYVRYDVLEFEAHALCYIAKNSETTTVDTDKMMTAFRKLEKLRVSVVCEPGKSASLANSFGYSSVIEVRVSENAKHLKHQGEMLIAIGDAFKQEEKDHEHLYEHAMEVFDAALQQIDTYESATGETVYGNTKERILEHVFDLNCKLGVHSISDEIQEFQKRLNYCEKSCTGSGSTDPQLRRDRAIAKNDLASVLLRATPPRYVEAIRLQLEAIKEFQTILGPDHSITINSKERERRMKGQYRDYLKCLASTHMLQSEERQCTEEKRK